MGRTARHGGDPLEALDWLAGHSPGCPICDHPTSGTEEQYARVPGMQEGVIVALAQPCGCLIDGHVAELQLSAASETESWPGVSA
ncbi:hypothetical protein SAMN05661080_05230 [Modestobacter sp. DSM 44400]|uniref:hypothetical protein n=1 Tax=Modestobacter sp. DSM 44400 TaxID=1550230 RepID=UPI00089734EF|nr:hypothetical protein [Modestobacter sp. DSM 44400]SDY99953.1 hypothetical protein SAMN05661080_05230 [Modestobacter sp. DSM 44400]